MLRRLVVLLLLVVGVFGLVSSASAKGKRVPPTVITTPSWIIPWYDRHCIGHGDIFWYLFSRPNGVTGAVTYQWKVNGVAIPNSNSPLFSYVWGSAGMHSVSVRADVGNYYSEKVWNVPIWDCIGCGVPSLKAFVSATPVSVCPGEPVTLTGRGEGFCLTGGMSYSWNFGDGSTGTGAVTSHTYLASGNYTVTLTVSAGGYTATATTVIEVRTGCSSPPGQPPVMPPVTPPGTGITPKPQPGNPTGISIGVQCRGKAVASINGFTGNVTAVNTDPVPTRGFPLTCNLYINSQTVETNRAMGNAAFTYDIHLVPNQTIRNADCSSYTAMVLVDEDGTRYPFTVAGMSFVPARGIRSSLTSVSGGYRVQASAPGAIDQAGGFLYDFDSSGRLAKITDPMGNTQTLNYNGTQLQTVKASNTGTGASQKTITFAWTGNRITQIQHHQSAQIVDLLYDASGRQIRQTTHANGSAVELGRVDYDYNADNTLNWMQRNNEFNTRVTFTYIQAKDCNGVDVPMCIGADGGSSVDVNIERASGTEASFVSAWVTNAQGGKTRYDFNSDGDVIRTVEPAPQGWDNGAIVTEYGYQSWNRAVMLVKLNDGREYRTYTNSEGLPLWTSDPLNAMWATTYIGTPQIKPTTGNKPPSAQTGANVAVGTVAYERTVPPFTTALPYAPTKYTNELGKIWTFSYNDYGQVTQTTTPNETGAPSIVNTLTYHENLAGDDPNRTGWLKSASDGLGTLFTINGYTDLGDVTSVSTTAGGQTHTSLFEWDAAQRLKKATRPDGKFTQLFYDGDNLTEVQGADYNAMTGMGSVTFGYCAHCGLMNKVNAPLGWELELTRNADHQLTGFVDARNKTTTYTYGTAGELKSVTLPGETASTQFFYDNVGRLRDVQGGTSTLKVNYDNADRVSSLVAAQTGQPNQTVAYTYNLDDSLHYLTDPSGRTDVTYNVDGAVNSVYTTLTGLNSGVNPIVQRVSYTYYANGSRKTMTWAQGTGGITGAFNTIVSWSYTYDARGRLTYVTAILPNGGAGTVTETTGYSYDNEDKLTAIANQNGTGTTFAYTPQQNWVSQISHSKAGGFSAMFGLTYDGTTVPANYTVGNLTQVVEGGAGTISTTTYGYDALYRLTSENRSANPLIANTFGYDLAGNRTSLNGNASTFTDSNKIATLPNNQNAAYDLDGNQTQWQTSAFENDTWQYSYDAWGHLKQTAWQGTDIPEYPRNWTYTYDAFGRRVRRNSIENVAAVSRYYIFDGDTLIGEITSGSLVGTNVTRVFTWGAAGLVSKREYNITAGTWHSRWYHFGASGETRRVTDASGTVVDTLAYDAYGNKAAGSTGGAEPFTYGGQVGYYDDGSGLYLCGLRWYNPTLGRWLTRDPIGYAGGANLYEYCSSNPVMGVDPDGLQDYTEGEIPIRRFRRDRKDFAKSFGTLNKAAKITKVLLETGVECVPVLTPLSKAATGKNVQGKPMSVGEHGVNILFAAAPLGKAAKIGKLTNSFRRPAARHIDWEHIFDHHAEWGVVAQERIRAGGRNARSVWIGVTEKQIKARVMAAWKNAKKVEVQFDPKSRITKHRYRGTDPISKDVIDMWFNPVEGIIESAFPVR